jgi:hypothetical protein
MTGELGAERRCQLPKPEGARKRARRLFAARSCTSGVDRRSRTEPRVRREMNVEPVVQPKAAPLGFSGWGVTGRERPRMDGKRRTPVLPAVAAWEGRSILPAKESRLFYVGVWAGSRARRPDLSFISIHLRYQADDSFKLVLIVLLCLPLVCTAGTRVLYG